MAASGAQRRLVVYRIKAPFFRWTPRVAHFSPLRFSERPDASRLAESTPGAMASPMLEAGWAKATFLDWTLSRDSSTSTPSGRNGVQDTRPWEICLPYTLAVYGRCMARLRRAEQKAAAQSTGSQKSSPIQTGGRSLFCSL